MRKSIFILIFICAAVCLCFFSFFNGDTGNSTSDDGPAVTVALLSGPISLDPATTTDGASLMVELNLFDTLVDSGGGNSPEIKPMIATAWDVSSDNLVYTFTLREDVTFHNGEKLTAKDIKYTFERVMVEPYTSYYAEMIDKVEIGGDYKVTVTLKYPFADFLTQIGGIYYGIVNEKAITDGGEEFVYKPVGTGPYKLDGNYVPGQEFKFAVNENYWGAKPQIATINYKILPDTSTAVVALQNSEVDFVPALSVNDVETVQNDSKLKVYQAPSYTLTYLTFYKAEGPFSVKEVREAVSMAIDKDNLINASFNGVGSVANTPLNSLMMGYTDKVPANEFDVEAAKELMAAGGYPDGFDCRLLVNSTRDFCVKAANVIQSQLKEIGINVSVDLLERATWTERLMSASFEFAIATLNWSDTNNMLTYIYDTNGSHNYDKSYSNAKIDAMLAQARESNDVAQRTALYTDVAVAGYEDRVIVPLFFPNEIVGANSAINGIEIVDNCYYPIAKWTITEQ